MKINGQYKTLINNVRVWMKHLIECKCKIWTALTHFESKIKIVVHIYLTNVVPQDHEYDLFYGSKADQCFAMRNTHYLRKWERKLIILQVFNRCGADVGNEIMMQNNVKA